MFQACSSHLVFNGNDLHIVSQKVLVKWLFWLDFHNLKFYRKPRVRAMNMQCLYSNLNDQNLQNFINTHIPIHVLTCWYCEYLIGSFSNTSYVCDSRLSFSGWKTKQTFVYYKYMYVFFLPVGLTDGWIHRQWQYRLLSVNNSNCMHVLVKRCNMVLLDFRQSERHKPAVDIEGSLHNLWRTELRCLEGPGSESRICACVIHIILFRNTTETYHSIRSHTN